MNFANDPELMDPGEMDRLLAKQSTFPKKYHQHADGGDTVSWLNIVGWGHRVFGCPCGWELRMVRFLELEALGVGRVINTVLRIRADELANLKGAACAAHTNGVVGRLHDVLEGAVRAIEAARNNDGLTAGQFHNFVRALKALGDRCPQELRHHITDHEGTDATGS